MYSNYTDREANELQSLNYSLTHDVLITAVTNVFPFPTVNRLLQLVHFVQCYVTVCSAAAKPVQADKNNECDLNDEQ